MKTFKQMLEKAKSGLDYWTEKAKLDFSVSIERILRTTGTNQKQLAEKLGTSPAYVSRIMSADKNLTIEQMVKIAHALDSKISIEIQTNAQIDYSRFATAKQHAENTSAPATTASIHQIDAARIKDYPQAQREFSHETRTNQTVKLA